jgi:hypothetical protein
MNRTARRLAALAALGTTIGIVGPVAGASAATPPFTAPAGFGLPASGYPAAGLGFPAAGFGFPATGLPAFTAPDLAFATPIVGQAAAVIGPTIITTAPSTFINTNNQVSAGSNVSGGQAFP